LIVCYGSHRHPIPWQQLIQYVDLVIMDAVEDVSEIGLRIEVVELCGLDDRHRAGQGLRAGIGPCK
jgi:hypothetical protein